MASREEIVDEIAGFALFADLATPQLERVAHTFDEQVYAEGERVLRQGLSGSAFHVILERHQPLCEVSQPFRDVGHPAIIAAGGLARGPAAAHFVRV